MQQMASSPPYDGTTLLRENAALKRELRWIRHLAENPDIPATDKLCIMALRWKALDRKISPLEPVKMFFKDDAEMIGVAPNTMGRRYKILAENGILTRTTEHSGVSQGNIKTHVTLGLTEELLKRPDKVFFKEPRNHGGKRFICPSCGGETIEERRIHTCKGCGHVISDKRRTIEPEEIEEVIDDVE